MPEVLEWRSGNQRDTLVHLIQQVGSGKVVIFPTDTSYVAVTSGLHPEAVLRLAGMRGPTGNPVALQIGVSGVGQALDWVPRMSIVAQRFARRIWPGPLTLGFPWKEHSGLLQQLPQPTQELIGSMPTLQLRGLCHESIFQVLQYFPGPLVFRPLQKSDGLEITSPEELSPGDHAEADTVLLDGKSHFSQSATEVEINGNEWKILRSGVVTQEDLQRLFQLPNHFCLYGEYLPQSPCRSSLQKINGRAS